MWISSLPFFAFPSSCFIIFYKTKMPPTLTFAMFVASAAALVAGPSFTIALSRLRSLRRNRRHLFTIEFVGLQVGNILIMR